RYPDRAGSADRPPGRRRRLQPADRRAAVYQPSHRRLPPAESLHQARYQLTEPARSRAPRPARRSTAGHAAGLIPGPSRAPPAAVPARPAIKTLSTIGSRLSTLADAHRPAPNLAWMSYLNRSCGNGGRDVRGAIPRVARQQREACVSISRDARNGPAPDHLAACMAHGTNWRPCRQNFVFTGGENMQSHPAKIVRADETDADAIITILSTGFQNDPVCRWLFPDDDVRERLHPEFFGPSVKMTLEDGEIDMIEDRSGTALWLPVTAHHEDQPGLGELYEPILGADYAERIAAFDERSTANHPDHEDHFYLPFIAVRPQFFDQGIGTALLCDRLAALDSQGLPTYLEASNCDSARLYERLGYK